MSFKKKSFFSLLLALIFVLSSVSVTSTFAAEASNDNIISNSMLESGTLSDQQREAFANLRSETAPSGLVGFEGDYQLSDGNDLVSVIVEFANLPAAVSVIKSQVEGTRMSSFQAEQAVSNDHAQFEADFNALIGKSNNLFSFGASSEEETSGILASFYDAINGKAVVLQSNLVPALAELDYVHAVYPNVTVQLSPEEMASPSTDIIPLTTAAGTALVGMTEGRAAMRVDELHELGIKGKGITVGVLDTGVDYNHPDLAGAFAGEFKGRNFVTHTKLSRTAANSPFDPMETTYDELIESNEPEIDPISGSVFYTAHGTHVSGTIVGRGVNSPVSALGVAPEANLLVYRVLGPRGTGQSDYILSALDKVNEDGCDVVNMSLGAAINDPHYVTSVAVNNIIIAHDIVFCISASNNGPNNQTLGAPGTSYAAITVANTTTPVEDGVLTLTSGGQSADVNVFYKDWSTTVLPNTDGTFRIDYPGLALGTDNTYKLVPIKADANGNVTGTGIAAEFTDAVKAAIKGNIVVVNRGANFKEVIKLAVAAEAGGLLIINATGKAYSEINRSRGELTASLPVYTIDSAEGKAFWNIVKANGYLVQVTALSDQVGYTLEPSSGAGPLGRTMYIKPDISSHGSWVLSSLPYYESASNRDLPESERYNYAYGRYTGTSMSSPHIAGVVALMRGYSNDKGLNWDANEIKTRLMNTAKPLSLDYSVFQVGAGHADAYRAIFAETTLTAPGDELSVPISSTKYTNLEYGSLSYGLVFTTETINKSRTVTLVNHTNAPKTFAIDHAFNEVIWAVKSNIDAGIWLDMEADSVTVPANGSAQVTFTLKSGAIAEDKFGLYDGYINFVNGDETYRMPFGVAVAKIIRPLEFAYLERPMISNGPDSHMNLEEITDTSATSSMVFKITTVCTRMYFILENPETGELIGELGVWLPMHSIEQTTDKYLKNVIEGHYYPYVDASKTKISDTAEPIPLGHNRLLLYVITAESKNQIYPLDFYNDHVAPTLTVNGLTPDNRLTYSGTSATISGNVYDLGLAEMQELGIKYNIPKFYSNAAKKFVADQSVNFLAVKVNGTYLLPWFYTVNPGNTYQEFYKVQPNGDFTVTVPNLTGTDEVDIELTVLDSFVPAGINTEFDTKQSALDMDLTRPCLNRGARTGIAMTIFEMGYYGANISEPMNITLSPSAVLEGITVNPTTIFEGQPAEVDITVSGTNLIGQTVKAYLRTGEQELEFETILTDGKGTMLIDSAPLAGTYEVVAIADGSASEVSTSLLVVHAPAEITSITVNPKSIVSGKPAELSINVFGNYLNGKDLKAYLVVNGQELYETALINNSASMIIPFAPEAGSYDVIVKIDGVPAAVSGTLTVTAAPAVSVRGVTINKPSTTTIYVSETLQLTANVFPEDASNKSVVWSTNDSRKATVDANGLVKALSNGAVKITVTTVDGKYSYEIKLSIKK